MKRNQRWPAHVGFTHNITVGGIISLSIPFDPSASRGKKWEQVLFVCSIAVAQVEVVVGHQTSLAEVEAG